MCSQFGPLSYYQNGAKEKRPLKGGRRRNKATRKTWYLKFFDIFHLSQTFEIILTLEGITPETGNTIQVPFTCHLSSFVPHLPLVIFHLLPVVLSTQLLRLGKFENCWKSNNIPIKKFWAPLTDINMDQISFQVHPNPVEPLAYGTCGTCWTFSQLLPRSRTRV